MLKLFKKVLLLLFVLILFYFGFQLYLTKESCGRSGCIANKCGCIGYELNRRICLGLIKDCKEVETVEFHPF
jgi:hypothetical protein